MRKRTFNIVVVTLFAVAVFGSLALAKIDFRAEPVPAPAVTELDERGLTPIMAEAMRKHNEMEAELARLNETALGLKRM
jgi:hypothetical protein